MTYSLRSAGRGPNERNTNKRKRKSQRLEENPVSRSTKSICLSLTALSSELSKGLKQLWLKSLEMNHVETTYIYVMDTVAKVWQRVSSSVRLFWPSSFEPKSSRGTLLQEQRDGPWQLQLGNNNHFTPEKAEREKFCREYREKRRCLETTLAKHAENKRIFYEEALDPHIEDIFKHLTDGVYEAWTKGDEEHEVLLDLRQTVQELQQNMEKRETQMKILSAEVEEFELMKTSQLERLAGLKQNNMFGFYLEESATPVDLNQAFEAAELAITKVSKQWCDHLRSNSHTFDHGVKSYSEYYFARKAHVQYAFKADVSKCFFKSFEREDYAEGNSFHLDSRVRQIKCLEYVHHSSPQSVQETLKDDPFAKYCDRKFGYLIKFLHRRGFHLETGDNRSHVNIAALKSDFLAAAKRVWLLHKLAFAFEPPARIFRLAKDAELDPSYMKPVVTMADDEKFVPKVGFMVAPGLFLGKTTIRAEVYLGVQ